MPEFVVTFGQRFRREVHARLPLAHPDGWVTIVADDYSDARLLAIVNLGTEWSGIYDGDPFVDEVEFYPRGELARLVDGQWLARHVPE